MCRKKTNIAAGVIFLETYFQHYTSVKSSDLAKSTSFFQFLESEGNLKSYIKIYKKSYFHGIFLLVDTFIIRSVSISQSTKYFQKPAGRKTVACSKCSLGHQ